MKKLLTLFALMLLCIGQVFAYDCEVDGIYYNLNTTANTATVTYGPGVNNTYSGTVIVPGTIEYGLMEYAVTEIGDDAFHECTSLTKVVLPQGLTTIGKSAFPGCVNLVSINIPSTVRTISNYAFCYCNFPSMTIPEGITTIGDCAFEGAKLSYISLPSTLTTIKEYAFHNCPNLTDVECKALTPPSLNSTSFLNITQDIVLHVPAESAASYSSAWGSVCSAVGGFNDLMKTSPSKCYTLTTPRSSLCVSKTSVTSLKRIASSLDETDPMQQFAFVKSGAEYYMMSVATHEYVSNTGKLVSTVEEAQPIYYLDGVLYFDKEHVIYIQDNHSYFKVAYNSNTTKDDGNTYVIKEVGDFDVNAAPVVVRYTAGDVRYQLNTQTHVAGVIGVASDEITEVTVPSTVEYDSEVYNVSSIEFSAFGSNTNITSVNIAEGITTIKGSAFDDCTNLTSITLPNSVAHIGEWALSNTAITSIEIPTSMTYISGWTFASCSSLQSVNIPENIDSITFAAFQNCTSLREVTIPSGIKKLQSYTFTGCSSLVAVHCNALTPPALNDGLAIEVPANAVLYVPEESASAYKASAWRTYFSYINCEPITDGYYFITNPTRSANNAVYEDVSVNGTKWGSYTVPSDGNFHASDAKYVWKISMNSNGKYTLQNMLTGRFMNKANKLVVAIPTTETATETFTIIPAERTTENEGHWILKNSSTATASDVSGYCSGVHAAVANNYVVQWDPSAPASHWDLIKLSEAEVAALENLIANKGNITFNYTIGGHEWRSQTKLFEDLSEVTVPEQDFVTIVSTSDLTDLHDGDVVTVECEEEDLPFLVTTDEEAPIYGIIHGHSNQDRYIYVDDSGNGKDTGSAGDPENVNDNYLWYITGNLIDGFRLHNKAFDGATLKSTATIATVNGTASDTWELRGAAKGSKFNNQEVFSLYQENVTYFLTSSLCSATIWRILKIK